MSATIEELRSQLSNVKSEVCDTQGSIQRLISEAERTRAALQASMDESNQSDVGETIAVLAAMLNALEEALRRSHQTVTEVENIQRRL